MEEVSRDDAGLHRRLKLFANVEADRNEFLRNFRESLAENEREELWVTPDMPLLLFAWIAFHLFCIAL
jgi:hypothetical protein